MQKKRAESFIDLPFWKCVKTYLGLSHMYICGKRENSVIN